MREKRKDEEGSKGRGKKERQRVGKKKRGAWRRCTRPWLKVVASSSTCTSDVSLVTGVQG